MFKRKKIYTFEWHVTIHFTEEAQRHGSPIEKYHTLRCINWPYLKKYMHQYLNGAIRLNRLTLMPATRAILKITIKEGKGFLASPGKEFDFPLE